MGHLLKVVKVRYLSNSLGIILFKTTYCLPDRDVTLVYLFVENSSMLRRIGGLEKLSKFCSLLHLISHCIGKRGHFLQLYNICFR